MTFSRRPRIQPKVSTMPRQRSEAAHYLDIYKLTVEKTRLQQELASLEQRRDRIQERLQGLEQQIATLDQRAQHLRTPDHASQPASVVYAPVRRASETDRFKTLTLEY